MTIGIMGAINLEIETLRSKMSEVEEVTYGKFLFYKGTLVNKNVVLVKAGVGKVNSSLCATLLVTLFNVEKLIFTGMAGGIDKSLKMGDIVVSKDLIQHDVDITLCGKKPGEISIYEDYIFKANDNLINLAEKAAIKEFGKEKVRVGRILTGDQFIGSDKKIAWLKDTFNGLCIEMEGAAVAQVCQSLNIHYVIIRSISDGADDNAIETGLKFMDIAAKNSEIVVENLLVSL